MFAIFTSYSYVNGADNKSDFTSGEEPSVIQDHLKVGGYGPEMVVVPLQKRKYRNCIKEIVCENSITKIVGSMVTIPYAISKYEITFNDYDMYIKEQKLEYPSDNGWGRENRPVIFVAWKRAIRYAEWLSDQSGFEYRLPTVIEWEHAARAGVRTAYWWGHEVGVNNANCKKCASKWSQIKTAPVGSFKPNPWGIHDMHGNVSEFALDCALTNRKFGFLRRHTNRFEPNIKMDRNCKKVRVKGGSWFSGGKSAFRREYSSLNPAFPEISETFMAHHSAASIGIRLVRIL